MEELTRVNLFKFMFDSELELLSSLPESLIDLYRQNYEILNNIEQKFYYSNLIKEQFTIKESDFLNEKEYSKIIKSKKSNNQFNSLLKLMIAKSDKVFKKNKLDIYMKNFVLNNDSTYNKVFLSYSYEDHLYTTALFFYFYSKNIYLYIDWMHNNYLPNGNKIKRSIFEEMNKCNQLLYLQPINVELNLSGNQGIKPWCAWEIGSFYRKNIGSHKFFLDLYFKDKNNISPLLEGINKLSYIQNGKLY